MQFIKTMLKEKTGKVNSSLSAPALSKHRRTMIALEPRIMFDGAAVETAVDATADSSPVAQDTAAIDAAKLAQAAADVAPPAVQADPAAQPQRIEVVFIESNVSDYQTLINGVSPDAEVHVLDASQDGLAQMAQILNGRSGIDAIHILSHGSEGSVNLGSLKLTSQNLQDHAADLATIGNALSQNGDILLYGCDVAAGSDGAALINALAQTTQADVGASTDATGSAARGGDWSLETATGIIDEPALSISSYSELLVAVDFTGDSGDTNNTNATVAGGSKSTITITDNSSGDILQIVSAGTTMYQDTATNLSDGPTGMTGVYIKTDSNAWTTSITFTVQGGKLFDFSSIKLQEANTDSPTFVFTSSKGSASSAYTGAQFKTIDLSADTNFQNITSVTMTVTGGGGGGTGFQANLDDITLNNIHLPGPSFTSGTTANFAENATGTVYTAAATASGGTVSYSVTGGADQAKFNIDSSSGALTFVSSPNFESPTDAGTDNVYDVVITATDSNGSATKNVAVTVTNVNEAPSITSAATASFAENATGTVYTATGSDPDSGQTLAWSIGGTDAALFGINSSTGVLTFNSAPNYEAPG
ncbi:MAG: DUF4347 domain-containing protein, partial [Methylobacter sp.]